MPQLVTAQTAPAIPPAINTPNKVKSRLGTLEFKDGVPTTATRRKSLRPCGLHAREATLKRADFRPHLPPIRPMQIGMPPVGGVRGGLMVTGFLAKRVLVCPGEAYQPYGFRFFPCGGFHRRRALAS